MLDHYFTNPCHAGARVEELIEIPNYVVSVCIFLYIRNVVSVYILLLIMLS